MSDEQEKPAGPDLAIGIPFSDIPDGGMVGGHVGDQAVLIARRGKKIHAIGGKCTHYGGLLAEGLMVGKTVRCPLHHACFDLRTGEATCAPALNPVSVWETERNGKIVRVTREIAPSDPLAHAAKRKPIDPSVRAVVIVGAGAAGNAAAEMLRRQGFTGSVTMIGMENEVPYDRPNLSKDYLAGTAPEEWIPLRPADFYSKHGIELLKDSRVTSIDSQAGTVSLSSGQTRKYDRLLLATGAEPVRPPIPGAELGHVHYLRTLADSRAIIEASKEARIAVVIGGSFIGLEVAAALRARGLQVDLVSPEQTPLARVLGPELGAFVRTIHEKQGVTFRLGRSVTGITRGAVRLDNGESLPADIVVVGVGVRPLVQLAVDAGADMSRGVVVNEYLATSLPGVFAAGDIARYPDSRFGDDIRIEHWVVAERQGQTAAKNMLGRAEPYTSVPFFWSNHYDVSISYVGHAESWDGIEVAGDIGRGDCVVAYRRKGKIRAVATIGRSLAALEAAAALEDSDWAALDDLLDRESSDD